MSSPETTRRALDEAIDAKVTKSNLEYDAYTHGLCNGLLLARAILDDVPFDQAKSLFGQVPEFYYIDRPYDPASSRPTPNWQRLMDLAQDAGEREESTHE